MDFKGALELIHALDTATPLFSSLRTLVLDSAARYFTYLPSAHQLPPIFTPTSAPLLEDVSLHRFRESGTPDSVAYYSAFRTSLPFPQLRRLVLNILTGVTPADVFPILQLCINLETLEICSPLEPIFRHESDRTNYLKTKLFLPKLASAQISVKGGHPSGMLGTTMLFRCLRAPALRRLSISPSLNMVFKHLYRFIQRSRCEIQKLVLIHAAPPEPSYCPGMDDYTSLPPLLTSMKNLQFLTIVSSDSDLVNTALPSLVWNQSPKGARRCSCLSRLTVISSTVDIDYDGGLRLADCIGTAIVVAFSRSGAPAPGLARRYKPLVPIRYASLWGADPIQLGQRVFDHEPFKWSPKRLAMFTAVIGWEVRDVVREILREGKRFEEAMLITQESWSYVDAYDELFNRLRAE